MKKILKLFCLLFILINSASAQELISIKNNIRFLPSCVRVNNNTIYLSSTKVVSYPDCQGILYRFTENGEFTDSLILDRPESTIIQSIYFRNDSTYLVCTKKNSTTTQYDLELIILDHQLQVIKDTILSQNFGNAIYRSYLVSDNENNLLIYGCYWFNFPNTGMGAYFLKIDYRGKVRIEKRYYSNLSFFINSLLKLDYNQYCAFCNTPEYFDSTNQVSTIAMTLDSNFNLINVKSTPHYLLNFKSAFKIGNHIFGSGECPTGNNKINYGLIKTNNVFSIKDSIEFGPSNIDNFAGNIESNIYLGYNKIYVAGTLNFYNAVGYPNATWPSQIQITRIDTCLNVIWNKKFSKDSIYYELWSMTPTTDNGCLLACESYNYLSTTVKRNIVVFKVDSNGTAYSVIGELPEVNEFSIYPNPTTDFINIESNEISQNASISIYNIQGALVQQLPLNSAKQQIDVSKYINGLYLIKIINCNQTRTFKILKN